MNAPSRELWGMSRPVFGWPVRGTAARPLSRESARSPGWGGADRGSVTAEIAVALPALVLVALAALWGVAIASAQLACADAARAGARAAARGESPAAVRVAVSRSAPEGAQVSVRRDGELTRVSVRVTPWPAFAQGVSRLVIEERAVALTEPGVVP